MLQICACVCKSAHGRITIFICWSLLYQRVELLKFCTVANMCMPVIIIYSSERFQMVFIWMNIMFTVFWISKKNGDPRRTYIEGNMRKRKTERKGWNLWKWREREREKMYENVDWKICSHSTQVDFSIKWEFANDESRLNVVNLEAVMMMMVNGSS